MAKKKEEKWRRAAGGGMLGRRLEQRDERSTPLFLSRDSRIRQQGRKERGGAGDGKAEARRSLMFWQHSGVPANVSSMKEALILRLIDNHMPLAC